MSKYKYYLTSRLGTREVFPVGVSKLVMDYNKKNNRSDFTISLKGKMTFGGEDFNWLYALELTGYRCEFVEILIKKDCSGVYKDFTSGYISLNSGDKWNIDKCTVTLSVAEDQKYLCYDNSKDLPVNLFEKIPNRITVSNVLGIFEVVSFVQMIDAGDPFELYPGKADPEAEGWALFIHVVAPHNNPQDQTQVQSFWIREKYEQPGEPPHGTWISIFNGAQDIYYRQPILFNKRFATFTDPVTGDPLPADGRISEAWYVLGPAPAGGNPKIFTGSVDNGLNLKEVVEFFIPYVCPGLKIRSDFFQWNPLNVSDINYVTGEKSKVLNLKIFQKSDVKRAFESNNATQFNLSFEDLLKDLCNTFQLEWEITDDGFFVIEHVSYKTKKVGLDLTQVGRSEMNVGKYIYSYDNDGLPSKEVFLFTESSKTGDFPGLPIIYSGACVGIGDTKDETINIEKMTTDMQFVLDNPDPDSAVSDDGFVLVACDENDVILSQSKTLGGSWINNTLAWSHLQMDYWRHNRVQKTFQMNGGLTTALSVKPTKIQDNLVTMICCGDVFNPYDYIKTQLGDKGTLKSAKYSLYQEKLVMTLAFPADENLFENKAPEAVVETVVMDMNTAVEINVLVNDTDADGNINPETLEIVLAPSHGTAVITVDHKILYTPETGYTGEDLFVYRVKDNWNEPSNSASIVITII